MMPKLPSDVISDILSRLPVKSLLRFRCVSKPWCTLIDGPDFIKLHLQRSIETNTNLSLILRGCSFCSLDLDTLDATVELEHPLKTPYCDSEFVGSCNGLLCLSYSEEENIIWNPSTKRHRKLPATTIEFPDYFTSCQYIIYGFGYDCVNDDYKVVRIIQFYGKEVWDSFDSEVKVYSSKSNAWRRIQDCSYYLRYDGAWGVLVNGALHWVASRKPHSDTSKLILAFDLGVEEFRIVPIPEFLDRDFHMNVGELGGCLCVLCNCFKISVDVWVMKDYGVMESWTKLFSVAQQEVNGDFDFVLPVAYSNCVGEVLLVQDGKRLISYDIKKKRVKNFRIRGLPNSFEAMVCWESLVQLPPNRDGGIDGKKQQAQKRKKNRNKKRDDLQSDGSKLKLNLPAELIENILSRLPTKALLRFKSVSKPWCTLIDSRDFVKKHLKQSIENNTNLNLILRDSCLYSVDFDSFDIAVELEHPLKSEFYGTDVLGCCNGLLCLYNGEEDVALWNPSTKKGQKLPVTPIDFPEYLTFCQYIIYGFGYDFRNDEYKLVRIVQFYCEDPDSFDSEVKVYSMKTNSWRRIQDFPYCLRYKRERGMFVGGALHWIATRTPESDRSNLIVAFDLGVEEYREVPQPNFFEKNFHMNIEVLGGCLIILANYNKIRVDIWVMRDYGVKESWSKLFSVEQPKVIRSFEYVRPLAYSKSGNEVLLVQDSKKFLWYDLKKKKVKNVRIYGMSDSFDAHICIGSLVPLNGYGGIDGKKQQAKDKKKNRKKRDDFLSEGFKLVL